MKSKLLREKVVATAIAWLGSAGVWKINLMVGLENTHIASFYEKLGYLPNKVVSLAKQIEPKESLR